MANTTQPEKTDMRTPMTTLQATQSTSNSTSNPILTSTSNPTATSPPRRPKQDHHYDRTYQCLRVYSEYDCGHELPAVVRDPRCWKCYDEQPGLCRLSNWDIGADGLCPDCEAVKRGEERARQRALARERALARGRD